MPKPAAGVASVMGKKLLKVKKGTNGKPFPFVRVYAEGCFDEWLAEVEAGKRAAIAGFDHQALSLQTTASTGNQTLEFWVDPADTTMLRMREQVPVGEEAATCAQGDLAVILDQGLQTNLSIGGWFREAKWDTDASEPTQVITNAVIEEVSIVPRGSQGSDCTIGWETADA